MEMELTSLEVRVIGCLIEKEITTPEQYPLSLNALVNACNQKSNREPVMQLSEAAVRSTLDDLIKKRLIREESGFGSRVPKFQHRFCNTEFGSLKLTEQELGILCTLFLRGPQTPGELRSRTARLCHFDDMEQVERALRGLEQHSAGVLVQRLPREPGKRESRYGHCFSGDMSGDMGSAAVAEQAAESTEADPTVRLAQLEQQVVEMRAEIEQLKQQLSALLD